MRHPKFYSVVILIYVIISQSAIGQNLYDIEIFFSGIDVGKKSIGVKVYQGFHTIPLDKDSSNIISKVIESSAKYPIVEISYFSSKHPTTFYRYFLTNKKCKIAVRYDKAADIVNVEQTSGVTSFEDGGLDKFKNFAKSEIETRDAYSKLYNYDFTQVDSVVISNLSNYIEAVKKKGIQFVRKYPNLLYSTWLFIYEIVGDPRYSKDDLLEIYNGSLKPTYKNTFEEKLILDKLDLHRLAVDTKAPLQNKIFKDLQGSNYSISSSGRKLVLINIWATWCVPCVAEIPRLKELYSKYKTSVEILSFSIDTDEQKLRNFIMAKELDWVNVFNQPEICRAFGSDMGIPQLFLLNEKGIIIYSKSSSADESLEILDATLGHYTEKQK